MRIGILTTKTTHHDYFVNKLKSYSNYLTIVHELPAKKNEEKLNYFEKKRDLYEKQILRKYKKKTNFKFLKVNNINQDKLAKYLKLNCDYLIVFGTRKIKSKILKYFKNKIFNLHGGDPQKYRGLDSHYWSIYHNDFTSLKSTIHFLDEHFDNGKIVYIKNINFSKKNKLYHVRLLNTEILANMCLKLLSKLKKKERIFSFKQKTKGRYYSTMPNIIKNSLEKKFNKFIKSL